MAEELTVYLDHHIKRENLRYQRQARAGETPEEKPKDRLELNVLRLDSNRPRKLRKPDFQRATNAWTPEDCRSLLETITKSQIVPSLIMWQSPENTLDYILDGAHRVSVVLAWLRDDWGEQVPYSEEFAGTDEEAERITQAAKQVRHLVNSSIGSVNDYLAAQAELDRLVEEGGVAPQAMMKPADFARGRFYDRLEKGHISFPVLWVQGDYKDAEQSFLKINKSGRQLNEWEKTLIENRDSSFARIVMSVAYPTTAKRYWPDNSSEPPAPEELKRRVGEILDDVVSVHDALLLPPYRQPIRSANQPLLVPPATEKRPFWVSEFLTVVEGKKGTQTETNALIARDKSESTDVITRNGHRLLEESRSALEHIAGDTSKSLQLVPTIYFYSEGGAPLRGFLYGFLYWLTSGNDTEVNERKRIFSAYRRPFEDILINQKKDLTIRFGRGIGSGSEITTQWANYLGLESKKWTLK